MMLSGIDGVACRAGTRMAVAERARLAALPNRVVSVVESPTCELVRGHGGPHVAYTVSACGGDEWWWLRWEADRRELVQIDPCGVADLPVDPHDCCLLPQDHPGPHSYAIEPSPVVFVERLRRHQAVD